ncbi:hypothetical protein Athai_58320 [Actinocatenispora thailandica]|uniref:Uncharacterized protein n=1 Tax=Actinocatenispora thailandica TaxID=227318 RepID=A0A7R7I0B1_9ACTN|nr:hypothetical protein [Actinocatenispora thailandica]BCJ38329.1 hypothetical protein Athai_58320 [Actinocatenispora thailandica]
MSDVPLLAGTKGDEVVRELLFDQLVKVGIVFVGLLLLAVGMALIWRRATRRDRSR